MSGTRSVWDIRADKQFGLHRSLDRLTCSTAIIMKRQEVASTNEVYAKKIKDGGVDELNDIEPEALKELQLGKLGCAESSIESFFVSSLYGF